MPSLSLKSVIKQTTTKSWGGIFIKNGKIKANALAIFGWISTWHIFFDRFGKRGSNYKDIAALFKHYRMLRELYGEEKKWTK